MNKPAYSINSSVMETFIVTRKNQGEFQAPGVDDHQQSPTNNPHQDPSGDLSGFESPGSDDAMAVEAIQAEMDAFMLNVNSQILSVQEELLRMLASLADETDGMQSQAAMDANIVGVSIGLGEGDSILGAPGEPVLEVYTLEPQSHIETRARLASVTGISALADSEFPIHTVHTGIVDAQPHRMRLRPAPGGISTGHFKITAGTLGCLVRGRTAPRSNRHMILSNNHVLADVNAGPIGAPILQPGPYDGGMHPADQIAVLERFVPVNFAAGASNVVDCATAWAWPDRVRRALMYISGGVIRYFRIGSTPVASRYGPQAATSVLVVTPAR